MKKLFILMLCVFFVGCSSEERQPSTAEMQKEYIQNLLPQINYEWWQNFDDPILLCYIVEGLENNPDLRSATLKTEEYKQFVKYTRGGEIPSASVGFEYFASKNIPFPLIKNDVFLLPLDISYEFDVFGKNHNKTKSAEMALEAYKYQVQATYITYISNLATVYFNIVKVQELIDIEEELLDIKSQILDETRMKLKSELATEIDVNKALQEYKTVQNDLEDLKKNLTQLNSQFFFMLGRTSLSSDRVGRIDFDGRDMYEFSNWQDISSDVIFNRPDILAVEKQLKKSEIDIKVARAEFLPTFKISGQLIWNNFLSGGFFSTGNTIRSLLAGVSQNLFTGGRLSANLEISKIHFEQLFEEYRKVALNAVKEINDALYILKSDKTIMDRNFENYALEKENFKEYESRNESELLSHIDLLKLKQLLLKYRAEIVKSSVQLAIDNIGLYKATTGIIKGDKNEK